MIKAIIIATLKTLGFVLAFACSIAILFSLMLGFGYIMLLDTEFLGYPPVVWFMFGVFFAGAIGCLIIIYHLIMMWYEFYKDSRSRIEN